MKKLIQVSTIVLILFAVKFQSTNANSIFENASETGSFIKAILSNNNDVDSKALFINDNPEVILTAKRISEEQLLRIQKSESFLNADFEEEMQLEDWMTDVANGLWSTDSEEPLQLENWMFDPCSWLCSK